MPLSNQTLRDLTALAKLKSEGGILDRHFQLLKEHLMKGCSLNGDSLEGFRLSLTLRSMGGLSEEEHAKDVDGKVADILKSSAEGAGASATPSAPPFRSASSSTEKSPAARSASAAGSKTANRGVGERKRAAANTLGGNILNCFAIGSGEPVRCVTVAIFLSDFVF